MRLHLKLAGILLGLPLLAGCTPEFESTIYVQDIDAVLARQEGMAVPAVLRVPQTGTEACTKNLETLIANLDEIAHTTGKGKCVERSGDQFAEIETRLIIATETSLYDEKYLFLLVLGEGSAPDRHALSFRLTRPVSEIVAALATDSSESQTDMEAPKFVFTLNNDSAGPVSFTPGQIYVDDKASMPETGALGLERRDTIEIRFSDVASEWISGANSYQFGELNAR